ncbi:uncharacterized protein LOC134659875 [Cydia amplana]|uniref:uncharacterized protein LOC134659875 n=1 Tax=Cydia amplana TaxID=1869771 RepID=UPI002FE55ABF
MPVILLDPQAVLSPYISKNPFDEMSSEKFSFIALDAIHKGDGVLIFVEEEFSVEDVASRDMHGTPYCYIHNSFLENKAKYMPRVVEPFKTLLKVLPVKRDNVMNAASMRFDDRSNYHYIHFADGKYVNETRVQMLRRHDDSIKNTYMNFRAKHKGPIIAFYTGKSNPMLDIDRRYKRPSPSKHHTPPDTIMLVTDHALIRLSEVVHHEGSTRTHLIEPRASTRRFASRRASTRVFYDGNFELDFNFEYLRDGWLLDSVVLLEDGEEVGRTPMGVGAPYDWSYFCSEPLIIGNSRDKSYVTIAKYQVCDAYVQPLLFNRSNLMLQDDAGGGDAGGGDAGGGDAGGGDAGGGDAGGGHAGGGDAGGGGGGGAGGGGGSDKTSFTNTQSCGTNFNCHILAGLFVAFMVISITFVGITVLYDCKSNDRMDDPSQKPLVIVAQL